jgi:hypothetical protein
LACPHLLVRQRQLRIGPSTSAEPDSLRNIAGISDKTAAQVQPTSSYLSGGSEAGQIAQNIRFSTISTFLVTS